MPMTIKPRKSLPKSGVDNFGEEAIRRLVHNFHIVEKRRPTLTSLYKKIRDDEQIQFLGGKTSLWKLLRKMGFRHVLVHLLS